MEFLTSLGQLDPQVVIQVFIQGGLTLAVLGLIWFLRYLANIINESNKRYFNHTGEVIDRNTDAWIENTKSNQKLVDVIDNLNNKLKK